MVTCGLDVRPWCVQVWKEEELKQEQCTELGYLGSLPVPPPPNTGPPKSGIFFSELPARLAPSSCLKVVCAMWFSLATLASQTQALAHLRSPTDVKCICPCVFTGALWGCVPTLQISKPRLGRLKKFP